MNAPPLSRCRRTAAGFNLIEVTLAVAIVGIGLITILGLVAGGVDASRGVSDETLICNLVDDMMDWARITPYGSPLFIPSGANLLNYGADTIAYFDANGNLLNSSGTTEYGQANPPFTGLKYYKVTFRPTNSPEWSALTSSVARVVITVEWPVNPSTGNPATKARRRVFVTAVARR